MNNKEDWLPSDIKLEENALKVVKSEKNMLVTAGPGAGKTELLAQRACFLFQTNTCEYPHKILAISFKKDAAKNLKERIQNRVGKDNSIRFDSMTYDAFYKSILDRFIKALPNEYKLNSDYEIKEFDRRSNEARSFIDACEGEVYSLEELQDISESSLDSDILCGVSLDKNHPEPIKEYIRNKVWKIMLSHNRVTFKMIARLAELLILKNPRIHKALNLTYSYIFLDEFQDTTSLQYSLLLSFFEKSNTIITAVGDDKQRIMLWAGAKKDIFDVFANDYNADKVPLVMNYRSNPELVEIQKNLASLITNDSQNVISDLKKTGNEVCKLFIFDDYKVEANKLPIIIYDLINNKNISPREICILVRQRADDYSTLLINSLKKYKISARVEDEIQNLLAEPLTRLILAFLKLGLREQSPESWNLLREYFNTDTNEREQELTEKIKQLSLIIDSNIDVKNILSIILDFLDKELLSNSYVQYSQDYQIELIIDILESRITKELEEGSNFLSIVNNIEGKNTIPIMTIHKSKGLEFHTVILLGLEDSAFWNYPQNPEQENCTLFVAFSRAKEQVFFTFAKQRPTFRGQVVKQSAQGIRPFVSKLELAGVKAYDGNTI